MKNNQGNIIIIFAIILLVFILIFVFTMKNKINEGWDSNSQKTQAIEAPVPKPKTSTLLSTPDNLKQPPQVASVANSNDHYEYYNDVSVIQNNEVINPFLTTLNSNPVPKQAQTETSKPLTANHTEKLNISPNALKVAPNGFNFPQSSSYLVGYPIKNKYGKLNITISNTVGHSNLAVFVYLKKQYNETRNTDLNELTAASYIRAGDTFKFANVKSGYYRIVWINLATKQAFKSKDFAVYQDNKYAYDRVFTFYPDNKLAQGKATPVPLASLYKHYP